MKKINFLVIIIFFLSIFLSSCTLKKEVKFFVVDTKGKPIEGASVNISSHILTETGKDGKVVLKLEPEEYMVKVSKPGFFSSKRKIDVTKEREATFKLLSFREGMSKIIDSIAEELSKKERFRVTLYGRTPSGSVSFSAFFSLDEGRIVVRSDKLSEDVVIEERNGNLYYNGNEFPEEEREYLPYLINIIVDSVLFLKDYPLRGALKYSNSTLYFSKISFIDERDGFKILGFFEIDNETLEVKKEYIDFFATDRLERGTHYTIIYYFEDEKNTE